MINISQSCDFEITELPSLNELLMKPSSSVLVS